MSQTAPTASPSSDRSHSPYVRPLFPADIPVAIVEKAELKEGASYYSIRVRLNTDFRKIGYVQLINKQSYDEIKSLTDEAN